MPRQPRTSANRGKSSKVQRHDIEAIPYARGFKPPTQEMRLQAIGFDTNKIPKAFNPANEEGDKFEFFKEVPKPTSSDDWLAQYNEEGQTYKQFLEECPWLSSRKRKYMSQKFVTSGKSLKHKYPDGKIYIVPVGDFDQGGLSLLGKLIEYTSIFLDLPVVSMPKVTIEENEGRIFWVEEPSEQIKGRRTSSRTKKNQLTSRYNLETKNVQVRVDSNLMQLRQKIPNDAICMIGLTMFDLYGEESDLFVAGMAAGNQRVAIFSLYRYNPCLKFSSEHWFQVEEMVSMTESEQQRIILQRGCKLLVHEICHLLGVDHCVYFDCCMNGSGHLEEDFRQPMHLCPVDLHKLQTVVGFSVEERYKALLRFYTKEGFYEEQQWVEKRLLYLSKKK